MQSCCGSVRQALETLRLHMSSTFWCVKARLNLGGRTALFQWCTWVQEGARTSETTGYSCDRDFGARGRLPDLSRKLIVTPLWTSVATTDGPSVSHRRCVRRPLNTFHCTQQPPKTVTGTRAPLINSQVSLNGFMLKRVCVDMIAKALSE